MASAPTGEIQLYFEPGLASAPLMAVARRGSEDLGNKGHPLTEAAQDSNFTRSTHQ